MPTDPLMAQYSQSAAPDNPVDAHLANASTATDIPTAIDNAQSLAGVGAATTKMAQLQEMSPGEQRAAWASATSAERSMLAGVGYKPPAANRGLFSRAVHDVFGAPAGLYHVATNLPVVGRPINVTGHAISQRVTHALEPAMQTLGASGQFLAHTYRAGAYDNAVNHPDDPLHKVPVIGGLEDAARGIMDTDTAGAAYAREHILHLSSPSDWADAWHATTHGDQTFDPNKARDIQASASMDDATFGLAKSVASKNDANVAAFLKAQLDGGAAPEDVAALEDQMNKPGFQKVVGQLEDAKFSFGRSLVPQWMWQHDHAMATVISGAGDALFSFLDPTIIGSKVNKEYKIAKFGFKSLKELGEAVKTEGFQNWAADVASYLEKGDYSGLLHRHSELAPTISRLAQDGVTTTEDLTAKALPDIGSEADRNLQNAISARDAARAKIDDSLSESAMKAAIKKAGLADATTKEAVSEWAQHNMLSQQIMSGNATAISHGVPLVPTLNKAGKAYLDSKDALRKAIDWSSDFATNVGPEGADTLTGRALSGTVGLLGTTAKRLTTLIPQGMKFNPMDPNAITAVQRFARAYLPSEAADQLVNRWAMASTLADKRRIYIDMLSQTFRSAGIDQSDDNPLMTHFVNVVNGSGVKQKYAANGIDELVTADGKVGAHGFTEKHMSEEWALPSYVDLSNNAQRDAFNKMVYGIANNPLAHAFSAIWKPLQLLRMGFPVRTSLEEMAGGVARNGPLNMAKSALATKALQGNVHNIYTIGEDGKIVKSQVNDGFGMVGPLADLNPLEAGFSRLLRMLPESVRPSIDTAEKLQSHLLAGNVMRGVQFLARKTPGVQPLIATAHKYREFYEGAFSGDISAVHTGTGGFANDIVDPTGLWGDDLMKTKLSLVKPTGDYVTINNGDDHFMSTWMSHLDDIASSGVQRKILKNLSLGIDSPKLRELIADHLQDPKFKNTWDASIRSVQTRDTKMVGLDVPARTAALDWADVVIKHVDQMLPEDEALRKKMANRLLKDAASPDLHELMKIPAEHRPDAVTGQEFAPLPHGGVKGVFREFVNKGFTRMGQAMNLWSRQPLHLIAVHNADKDLAPIVAEMYGDTPMADEILHALVNDRANAETLKYVHDPKVRSQMNVLTQNLLPFQFAQEQFWKRWARTFVHSPEAMREAQLAHHALGATGLSHLDSQGNEIFTYPMTGFAQKAVAEGLTAVGIPASLPVAQAFTGEVKMVAPGLSHTFAPSFGPLISIPLNALASKYPELGGVQHAALGDIGSNRAVAAEIFPATVTRSVSALFGSDKTSTQYANAEMRAIQDLYAADPDGKKGITPPPDATPQQIEEFMTRVKHWTRVNAVLRAAIGFSAPAAPTSEIGSTKIGNELRLLSDAGLNFTTAMQELVKRDPNVFPYTVFESIGTGSATLPATEAAAKMLEGNADFFKKYAKAGGFFLPTKSNNDKFSQRAYQDQLLALMRTKRSPADYLKQLMYTQAAGDYYDTRDAHTVQVKGLRGQALQDANDTYARWKAGYLADHPVFADELQSATAVIKRGDTLADLRKALGDPNAPRTDQVSKIQDLIDTYDAYQQSIAPYKSLQSTRANEFKKAARLQFATWAKNYTSREGAGALDVYNHLIRPEVDPDNTATTGA